MEPNRIKLHAAYEQSLADPLVADLVVASAHEVAERQGVASPEVAVHPDHVELSAPLPQAVLLSIAAELRKVTGRWHRAKFGAPLWRGE